MGTSGVRRVDQPPRRNDHDAGIVTSEHHHEHPFLVARAGSNTRWWHE
jgi:hypothetical protein